MSIHNYGIVGASNTTVTMYSTFEEDAQLSVNDKGEKLPDDVITKRHLSFSRHRLAMHITDGNKDQSAELPGIFPIN